LQQDRATIYVMTTNEAKQIAQEQGFSLDYSNKIRLFVLTRDEFPAQFFPGSALRELSAETFRTFHCRTAGW
jgi:hypothetical protein